MLPGMMKVLQNGQTKFQIGGNENLFDFTYIGNSAYSHILAAEKLVEVDLKEPKTKDTVDGEVFIITNGQPVYYWDFPRAVAKPPLQPDPPPPTPTTSTHPSIAYPLHNNNTSLVLFMVV